jgi:hypothetical protein
VQRGLLLRLAIGWLLLCCTWVFANPPLAAPDEADHYVRAIGISQGNLIGAPAPDVNIGANPAEIAFDKSTQRAVMVPARLDPSPYGCYLSRPRLSAACLNRPPRTGPLSRYVTSVGTYPPLGLLGPAAVLGAGQTPAQAVRLGRVAAMIVGLALVLAAAATLYDRASGWLSLVGILGACTPTALFLVSSLTPSGMSVSAAIALTAALLRVSRDQAAPLAVWILAGIAAAALMGSHPTGLLWTALLIGAFVVWHSRRRSISLVRTQRRGASAAVAIFGAGALVSLTWQALYGPNTPVAYRAVRLALGRVPSQYWGALREVVAGFGYLEFMAPLVLYLLWFAFVALTAVAAGHGNDRRQRGTLIVAALSVFVIPVGLWLVFGRAAGIGINGREYMPLLVAFPLLAGEMLLRRRESLSSVLGGGLAALASISGVLQFVAWYFDAQRSAVGTGGQLFFVESAQWTPPLGWATWIVVAGLGALSLASVPLSAVRGADAATGQRSGGRRSALIRA